MRLLGILLMTSVLACSQTTNVGAFCQGPFLAFQDGRLTVAQCVDGVLKTIWREPLFAEAETPSGVLDGTNTSFAVANTPTGSLLLTRNGLVLKPGSDYVMTGKAISFINGVVPQAGDLLQVWYRY